MKNKYDKLTTQNLKFLKNKIEGNSNFSFVWVLFPRNLSKWKYFRKKWANCWGSKVSEKLVEGKIIFLIGYELKTISYFSEKTVCLRSGEDEVSDDHLVALLNGQKKRSQLAVGILSSKKKKVKKKVSK